MIANEARVGYHLISNKRFNKKAPKILKQSSRLYFVRRNRMGNVKITFKCVNCLNLHCFALSNTDALHCQNEVFKFLT